MRLRSGCRESVRYVIYLCFLRAFRNSCSAAILAALVFLCAVAASLQAQTPQVLHNHVRPEVVSGVAPLVGPMPGGQRMNLSIVLPLRNQDDLRSFLKRVYDPSSPDYRHFLSVADFTARYGPTAEDYRAVVDFARASGFTVTGSPDNRRVVPISGTVDQINRAFNVTMNVYQHPAEQRTMFSPDREPSLSLSVPIAHISGLDNLYLPHPMVIPPQPGQAAPNAAGSGPGGWFLASDMRSAYYGGTTLDGTGQVVGLLEFDGYNPSDVSETFTSTGQTYNVPISNVLLDGATGAPVDSGDNAEVVLDIVQAIGMAPGLSQVRVYIGGVTNGVDDASILNSIATLLSRSVARGAGNRLTQPPTTPSSWKWLRRGRVSSPPPAIPALTMHPSALSFTPLRTAM
jgi:subtilase family serine protease